MITITISERAVNRIRELLADIGDDAYGLRVGVRSFGWTEQYRLSLAPGPAEDETVVRIGELAAFVPAASTRLVDGVRIDYVEAVNSAGFTFHHPRPASGPPPTVSAASGPPPTVWAAPGAADDALWQQVDKALDAVRPVLWRDGGDARIVAIDEPVAWIELVGACSGCAASAVTLVEVIERELCRMVPGITSVRVAA